MDGRKLGFLIAVLGQDGASALAKAAERSATLGNALVPRAILAWVTASESSYEGLIPGQPESYLRFKKTEPGYEGSITIGKDVYDFVGASTFHLGACVAVAVGAHEERVDVGIRDLDLERLGKSIDLLVRGRIAAQALAKQAPQQPTAQRHGVAAAPLKPKQPDPLPAPQKQPQAPSIKPPTPQGYVPPPPKLTMPSVKIPGMPKITPLKVAKALVKTECRECGLPQFDSFFRFKGCMCFRAMSKSVTVVDHGLILELHLGADWDEDARDVLLQAMGGSRG